MKKIRILPALATLLLPALAQGSVLTGFESAEGFAVGDTGKTVGQWVLPAQAVITDEEASAGTQSVKMSGTQILQYNPTVTQIGADYNAFSFQAKAEAFVANGQIGLWQALYGGNQTESRVDLQLFFGATADAPIRVEYRATYSGVGAPTSFTTVYIDSDLLDWTEIFIGLNFTDEKFRITIGGQTVASYEDLATGINQPRVARFFIRGGTGTVTYYDNMLMQHATVIPEPAAASLLLLPMLYGAFRYRSLRRSAS